MKKTIAPFKNERDCLQLGNLTIENRIDRVSIFGSIEITRDQAGLAIARELRALLDLTLAELEKAELPEQVNPKLAESVDNPFA